MLMITDEIGMFSSHLLDKAAVNHGPSGQAVALRMSVKVSAAMSLSGWLTSEQ